MKNKKHLYLMTIMILTVLLSTLFFSNVIASEDLPGSFTVVTQDRVPQISQLGLYNETNEIVSINSGLLLPDTKHSIRFTVLNDYEDLEVYSVRVAFFKSLDGSLEDFNAALTNDSGDAFVITFNQDGLLNIEYQVGFGPTSHSFDDRYFNTGLDSVIVSEGLNRFDFQVYFNLSKVSSVDDNFFIGVSFSQTINNKIYTSFASNGSYQISSYFEFILNPIQLVWALGQGQTYEIYDYTSEESLVIIENTELLYISNTTIDLDMYASPVWIGQDLDLPNDSSAIVEAYLSTNPIEEQEFGLKVNLTGVPNSGIDLTDVNQTIGTLNKTSENGSFGVDLYIWLGILSAKFENGVYNGSVYLVFIQ